MTGAYGELVGFLKTRAPGFVRSPEYQIHNSEMDDLPGVVLASFGKYLARIAREDGDTAALLNALNELAGWKDHSVQSQLRDELLEAIRIDPEAERILRARMTGPLQAMYEQWKNGE